MAFSNKVKGWALGFLVALGVPVIALMTCYLMFEAPASVLFIFAGASLVWLAYLVSCSYQESKTLQEEIRRHTDE